MEKHYDSNYSIALDILEAVKAGSGTKINNQNIERTITENGQNTFSADEGFTGLGTVTINTQVPEPYLVPLNVDHNGAYNPEPDVDGFSSVVVSVPGKPEEHGKKTITENGQYTYFPTDGSVFSGIDVDVNVPGGASKISVKDTGIKFSQSTFTEVPEIYDFTGVTDMSYMFSNCKNLTTIPLIDTSSATDMKNMFGYSNSLTTIPLIDTSSVTNMYNMFGYCESLTTIPLIDTSLVTSMNQMFYDCSALTSVPQLNTSKVTDMYNMFTYCTSLTTIPFLDTSSVENINEFFGPGWSSGLSKLTDLRGFKDLGKSSDLQNATVFLDKVPNLTVDSLMNVINNLYDRKTAGYSVVTLNFGSNLNKLTPEQIQIATDKGWTLV